MSKANNKEVTTAPRRKYAPTRVEVLKTVVIAMLITGVAAFIAGVHYADGQQAQVRQAVQAAAETPASK